MILQCSRCNQLTRIDEAASPPSTVLRLRCPHCGSAGFVKDAISLQGDSREAAPAAHPGEILRDQKPVKGQVSLVESGWSRPGGHSEPALPEDAFKNFDPALREQRHGLLKGLRNTSLRSVIWGVISVVVILFFSLLVNLLLPGPSDQKLFNSPTNKESGASR